MKFGLQWGVGEGDPAPVGKFVTERELTLRLEVDAGLCLAQANVAVDEDAVDDNRLFEVIDRLAETLKEEIRGRR